MVQKPAWVGALVLIWIIVVPGVILTHLALADLSKPLKDLPKNVVKGFDEIFKFEYLEQDSLKVKSEAASAVTKCGENASVVCPKNPPPSATGTIAAYASGTAVNANLMVNVTLEKNEIDKAFGRSLTTIDKVTNDPYLGLDDFKTTADSLNEIQALITNLPDTEICGKVVPGMCEVWRSADDIVLGMDDVTEAIDKFKNDDVIKDFDKYEDYIDLLHILPYFMVFALIFFTYFFYQGGVCCCCRGGTIRGSLALFPVGICWCIAFIIWIVICAAGIIFMHVQDEVKVEVLKGDPTIHETIDHIQTNYPDFWNVVFADLEDGLRDMYFASWFVVTTAILIFVFTCCVCICQPYKHSGDKPAESAPAAPAAPAPADNTESV
jgi:hypothetical protein